MGSMLPYIAHMDPGFSSARFTMFNYYILHNILLTYNYMCILKDESTLVYYIWLVV